MGHPSAELIARRYFELFNLRRLHQAECLVSSQAVFYYPHAKQHLIGRAGYRELVRSWLTAFPDARIDVQNLTIEDTRIVHVDLLGRGTHTGPFAFGGRFSLAPSGRQAELPLRQVIDVYNGQIVSVLLHFDMQEMLRLLQRVGV